MGLIGIMLIILGLFCLFPASAAKIVKKNEEPPSFCPLGYGGREIRGWFFV